MICPVAEWSFLTNHARVLVCIAHDPGVRLRDIATALSITERTAYGIVTDLTAAGYVVKDKNGRRNRYQIQVHLPLREAVSRERTIGEVLELLVTNTRRPIEADVVEQTGPSEQRKREIGSRLPSIKQPVGGSDVVDAAARPASSGSVARKARSARSAS